MRQARAIKPTISGDHRFHLFLIGRARTLAHIMTLLRIIIGNLLPFVLLLLSSNIIEYECARAAKKSSENIELPCTKQAEADVDVVFGRMSGYGNVSRSFPSNQNELNDYCK